MESPAVPAAGIRRSRCPPKQFFPQPSSLERLPLGGGDRDIVALLAEMVEQRRDRHEPAVPPAEASHELFEPLVQVAVLRVSMSEMGVHDARAAIRLEA